MRSGQAPEGYSTARATAGPTAILGSRVGDRDDSRSWECQRSRRDGRLRALARDWLSDLLLFFCAATFVVGIVVAAASLLS
jgi:hypothetical protein